jgi:class 3 adenylate cyclase
VDLVWLHIEAFALSLIFVLLLAGRRRFGLAPAYVGLGLLITMVWLGGKVSVPVIGGLSSRYGSVLFLPLILTPIVGIYVLEGTSEARRLIVGLVLGSFFLMFLRTLWDAKVDFVMMAEEACAAAGQMNDCAATLEKDLRASWEFRILPTFASTMGMLVSGVAIVVVYQALMNAFPRMSFIVAFVVALYTGLASDAVLYGGLLGLPFEEFSGQFLGKMTTGVVVAVPLSIYLAIQFRRWPEHVRHGVLERSAFDIVRLNQELRAVSGSLDRRVAEYAHMRNALARFITADSVDRIIAEAETFHASGEHAEVTLMKTDIRGFSSLVENMAPEQAALFLKSYLDRMRKVMAKHGGVVAEEDGDNVLTVFQAHGKGGEHAQRAMQCVAAMQRALDEHNEVLKDEGVSGLYESGRVNEVAIRVGLHSGPVVAGDVGIPPDHTLVVIGDAVSTVRHVEAMAKRLKVRVLMTESTAQYLGADNPSLKPCGSHAFKGHEEAIQLFEWVG